MRKMTEFESGSYRISLPPHLPGDSLKDGRYIISRLLCSCGSGNTYLAMDIRMDRKVVLKELFVSAAARVPGSLEDQKYFEINRKRFFQEERILSSLPEEEPQGIVRVLDHFTEQKTPLMAIEFADGPSLAEIVGESRLTYREIISLFAPICRSLFRVHGQGAVHLGICPENIRILDGKHAKLLDFGGAKIIGGRGQNERTDGYSPWEQYEADEETGPWSDVYSAAAVICYCLTGKTPEDAWTRKLKPDLRNIPLPDAGMPRRAQRAVRKALEPDPRMRYQSMEQFWADFSPEPSSVSRKRIAVRLAAGLMAALAAGLGIRTYSHRPACENSAGPSASGSASEKTAGPSVYGSETASREFTVPEGTYLFENAQDRRRILGVDSGFGDDGARLVLTEYKETNQNRFFVIRGEDDSGFYSLRAAHTDSIIEKAPAPGNETGILGQFSAASGSGAEWKFIYCGEDEKTGMARVIIQNQDGLVMTPQEQTTGSGFTVVDLSALQEGDDSQEWYLNWSEKDLSEKDVRVYHAGDMTEDLKGNYTFTALFPVTGNNQASYYMCMDSDKSRHAQPTAVTYASEWVTDRDTAFVFRIVPAGYESRYRIYPLKDGVSGEKCLEYIPGAPEEGLVEKKTGSSARQLFRIIYGGWNTFLLQTSDETVAAVNPSDTGSAEGRAVQTGRYDTFKNPEQTSWIIAPPPGKDG